MPPRIALPNLRLSINRAHKLPLTACYVITLTISLLALTYYWRIQPIIPMFYTLALPERQLVAKEWIFFFPALAIFMSITHTTIISRTRENNLLIVQLFAWLTVVFLLLLAIALIRIITLIV